MVLTGYAHQLDGDLAVAQIIAREYVASGDPALLAAHCLEAVDAALAEQVQEGDILVLHGSLTGGEQIEAAVLALQALGVVALLCSAADAAFARLAGEYGLPVLTQPAAAAAISSGDLLRLDLARGSIEVRGGTRWQTAACPEPMLAAVRRNQLLSRMRRVVEDEGFAE